MRAFRPMLYGRPVRVPPQILPGPRPRPAPQEQLMPPALKRWIEERMRRARGGSIATRPVRAIGVQRFGRPTTAAPILWLR